MHKRNEVKLIPANQNDQRSIYEWLTQSNLTSSMIGPPDFTDHPIPTWDEFCDDYTEYFFDGSKPYLGRSFIVVWDGEVVGHINYTYNEESQVAELDIWLKNSTYVSKGIGSRAIKLLQRYLVQDLDIKSFLIRPSERNKRAIRAYQKTGFTKVEMSRNEIIKKYGEGDYEDEVVLIMHIASKFEEDCDINREEIT